MTKFKNIVHAISRILALVSHVAFLGIMLLTVSDIVLRTATGGSILGAYELVERMMICGVFASFAYTQSEHGHVQITLLLMKFPKRLQFLIMGLCNAASIAASVLVAYAAYSQSIVAKSSNYTTGVLLIPTYPFYYVEIVAMVVLSLAFFCDFIRCFYAIVKPETGSDLLAGGDNAGF